MNLWWSFAQRVVIGESVETHRCVERALLWLLQVGATGTSKQTHRPEPAHSKDQRYIHASGCTQVGRSHNVQMRSINYTAKYLQVTKEGINLHTSSVSLPVGEVIIACMQSSG